MHRGLYFGGEAVVDYKEWDAGAGHVAFGYFIVLVDCQGDVAAAVAVKCGLRG